MIRCPECGEKLLLNGNTTLKELEEATCPSCDAKIGRKG